MNRKGAQRRNTVCRARTVMLFIFVLDRLINTLQIAIVTHFVNTNISWLMSDADFLLTEEKILSSTTYLELSPSIYDHSTTTLHRPSPSLSSSSSLSATLSTTARATTISAASTIEIARATSQSSPLILTVATRLMTVANPTPTEIDRKTTSSITQEPSNHLTEYQTSTPGNCYPDCTKLHNLRYSHSHANIFKLFFLRAPSCRA